MPNSVKIKLQYVRITSNNNNNYYSQTKIASKNKPTITGGQHAPRRGRGRRARKTWVATQGTQDTRLGCYHDRNTAVQRSMKGHVDASFNIVK